MPQVTIGDATTGHRLLDIPYLTYDWATRVNSPDSLSCTVTLADAAVRALDLRNAATPKKTFLAIEDGDNIFASGLINDAPSYSKGKRRLTISADGWGAYLKERLILPSNALTDPLFLTADLDAEHKAGDPNPATNTVITGWSFGTINKKLIQQALAWPGGAMPFVFQPDEAADRTITYLGSNLKTIYSAIDENSKVEYGPDWAFRARRTADRKGIEVQFLAGTEAQPRLASSSIHRWDYSVAKPVISGLEEDIDTGIMTNLAWTTGGRSTGAPLVAFARNQAQLDAGFPLSESVDADHSTVTEQDRIQSYSNEAIRRGSKPARFWTFKVRTDASPFPGEYFAGDYCDVIVKGDPHIPDDTYRRRITGLSGNQKNKWITVTTSEVFDG